MLILVDFRCQEKGVVEPNLFIVGYTAYTDEEGTCRASGMDYFCKRHF